MSTSITPLHEEHIADAELVARSVAGDKDAFGRIVARHQTLVCSLAYSATGSLSHSEDLAQETFLTAWRDIGRLREPEKLRAWISGIARNTINNRVRRLSREPSHRAAELGQIAEVASREPAPSEQAVSRERETILWEALERIPESYREPLILFYRHHKSVERVAEDLGISEEVVRQRLSRGRKLLQEQVASVLEDTLGRTTPGLMFTTAVIGSLPLVAAATMGSAAGTGAALAKGGAMGAGAKLVAALSFVIGPLLGIVASWLSIRASIKEARTPRERVYLKRYYGLLLAGMIVATVISGVLAGYGKAQGQMLPGMVAGCVASSLVFVLFVIVVSFRAKRDMRLMRVEEQVLHPECFPSAAENSGAVVEYRSSASFLGLPLLAVRLGVPLAEKTKPTIAWVAVGDYAVGALVGIGGVVIAPFAMGGLSLGLISVGALAIGCISIGGLALGGLAIGGMALGFVAEGFNAFGWHAAQGWYAAAREFALGRHAAALHANDAVAAQWFAQYGWFDLRTQWGKALLSLCWLPAVWSLVHYRYGWRRSPGKKKTTG